MKILNVSIMLIPHGKKRKKEKKTKWQKDNQRQQSKEIFYISKKILRLRTPAMFEMAKAELSSIVDYVLCNKFKRILPSACYLFIFYGKIFSFKLKNTTKVLNSLSKIFLKKYFFPRFLKPFFCFASIFLCLIRKKIPKKSLNYKKQ